MNRAEEPDDLTRAQRLARLITKQRSRRETITAILELVTNQNDKMFEAILEDQTLSESVRQKLALLVFESIADQNEWLFSTEMQQVRRFLEHLSNLGLKIDKQSHELLEMQTRFDSLMQRAKNLQTEPIIPLIRDFSKARQELLILSERVEERALDALQILCQKINRESSDKLFGDLTGDL